MKKMIQFSLNNKFAILILTLIVTVGGLYAGFTMKQETIPNIEIPVLTLVTVYPGATPDDVAENVTKPLELRVKNLNGVDTMSSTSMENASSIIVQYTYGKSMDEAEDELKAAINGAISITGVQTPQVSKISMNMMPVVSISVSGSDSQTLEDITKIVESDLKPALESIDGVASVAISGQQMKEIQLVFDATKMAQLKLSEDTVKGIVQASAIKAPLGLFELDKAEKSIIVDGGVVTLDDLKNLAIPVMPSIPSAGAGAGSPAPSAGTAAGLTEGMASLAAQGLPTVKLSDIADIKLVEVKESFSRTNKQDSIGINITKTSEANTVDVVNAAKDEAKRLEKENAGLKTLILLDQGKPIEQSVSTMLEKAIFGALFAVIVIMLFLRNFRTTLISIVSIPLSLLIALLFLKQMNITLNILTLGAMTVAIGRVVDDSIVVIENIYRRMSLTTEKLKGKALIVSATREMFVPILSSTLVTIAVFVPLGLVSGMIGELFLPFAETMVFALLASLLVAVTVVPALAHLMFRKGLKESKRHEEKTGAIAGFYKKVLTWSLNHKAITSAIAVVLLLGSLVLSQFVGVSFLPEEEEKYAMVTYSPPAGARTEDVVKIAGDAENLILDRPGVTNLQYGVGGDNIMSFGSSKNSVLFYVQYKDSTKGFADEKRKLLESLTALEQQGSWSSQDMGSGLGGGNKLSLYVYGDTIEDVKTASDQILGLVKKDPAFEKADTSLSESYALYTLAANQAKLSQYGLTAGQIAMELAPQRTRPVLTKVEAEGKEYQVYVTVDKEKYETIADIENKMITSPLGISLPLKELVTVKEGTSPNAIVRQDGKLYAEVSANILSEDVGSASDAIKKEIDKLSLPKNVTVDFSGVTAQINEAFTQLGLAMLAAIAIVYLLLVITFGGALTPFTILFSLPFILVGGLLGLFIAGETISVSVLMGVLMLIGIVVTNAIVLLDRVQHKEKDGATTREALIEAGVIRLRPILMTALATIGALLPLVLGFEGTGGALISKGLGVTVIGGLTSSTLLTLIIVPVVYEALARFRKKSLIEE
ncbi:MAG: efflux RND transporter permease subunit [Gorillibacterium sp.]|nr:efflux RND transporter permease subunit [Gorillibacterium sp.]